MDELAWNIVCQIQLYLSLFLQSFGFCNQGHQCPKSHNVEWILDNEQDGFTKKREKRKRRRQHQQSAAPVPLTGVMDTEEGKQCHSEQGQNNGSQLNVEKEEEVNMDTDTGLTSQQSQDTDSSLHKESSSASAVQTEAVPSPATREGRGHRAGFDAFMTGYIFAFFISQYGQMKDLPDKLNFSDFQMDAFRNKLALNGKDVPLQIMKSNFTKTSKEHKAKMERLLHFKRS